MPLFRASSGLLSQSSRRCRPNTEVTARSPCGRRGVLALGVFPNGQLTLSLGMFAETDNEGKRLNY